MTQRFGDLLCLHLQGRRNEETSVDKTSVSFSRNTLNQSTCRIDRRRSEICSSHSGLAEVSDVALCRWASICRRFVPLLPLLSPAILYLHQPNPSHPPARLFCSLLKRKALWSFETTGTAYHSGTFPEDVSLQNVGDACPLAVKS